MSATDLTEITILGEDDTGVLSEITSFLFEHDVDIENLDQTVTDELVRMTLYVDTSEMTVSRETFENSIEDRCDDIGVDVQVWFPNEGERQSLAALVTKESHCLETLLEAEEAGELGADLDVVIGNHSDLEYLAEAHDVPFYDVGDEDGNPDEDEMLEILSEYDIDVIALARYIQILSPKVVFRYQHRIINVHPSLLPAFPGAAAYRQAIEKGARIAGVTAHYVIPDLDQGPIITQRAFNVPDEADVDDLRRRGQPLEADALLEAIQLHLDGDVEVERGRTYVDDEDAQLGLPEGVEDLLPDEPIDDALEADT